MSDSMSKMCLSDELDAELDEAEMDEVQSSVPLSAPVKDVRNTIYYECLLMRLAECHTTIQIAKDFLQGECPKEVLDDVDDSMLSIIMAYQRFAEHLVVEKHLSIHVEALDDDGEEVEEYAAVSVA
jgi:hypothetical protein